MTNVSSRRLGSQARVDAALGQLSRRSILRSGLILGGGVVGGGVLAACGSDDSGTDDGGGDDSSGETEPQAASDEAERGGELVVGFPFNPAGLDPYQVQATNSAIDNNAYARLLNYAADRYEPIGVALESWSTSDDGTGGEVTLRPDQVFHSGNPVTADDVVTLFVRAMSDDGVTLQGPAGILDGVERVDDLTVSFTFKEPVAESVFTDMLSVFRLVEGEVNSSEQLQDDIAGTGAFELVEYQPNVRLVLERFENFVDPDLPYLDRLVLRIFDDAETMVSGLRDGQLDAALLVPLRSADELEAQGFTIVSRGPLHDSPGLVGINPSRPPFDNKLVRQAVQHSINRERIVQDVFFGRSEVVPLPFLPSSPVYGGQTDFPETAYDLDEAKRLLDESGVTDLSAEALVGANPNALAILQIMQADLREIGFEMEINQIDQQTYVDRFRSGDVDIFYHGSGGDRENPFAKTIIPEFNLENNAYWVDGLPEEFVEGMLGARSALDDAAMEEAATKIRNSVIDEAWCIGVVTETQIHAVAPGVEGVGAVDGDNDATSMARAWLSE